MIDIKEMARAWLIEHEHYEDDPLFDDDLKSLCDLLLEVEQNQSYVLYPGEISYDPSFGDDKKCECGHPYYRHFDTYEDMAPVGCKYCQIDQCSGFKEKVKENA